MTACHHTPAANCTIQGAACAAASSQGEAEQRWRHIQQACSPAEQHLFTIYVHAPPDFPGARPGMDRCRTLATRQQLHRQGVRVRGKDCQKAAGPATRRCSELLSHRSHRMACSALGPILPTLLGALPSAFFACSVLLLPCYALSRVSPGPPFPRPPHPAAHEHVLGPHFSHRS